MITVLAEKPSVAKDIASVLGVTKRNDGYFSNEIYNVTWSYGHLVTLAMPNEYGWEKWDMVNLPMLPNKFKLTPIDNSGAKKQLKILAKLFNNSSKIIVGTDAGREGELIYRLIYSYINPKVKNVERLWISDLTPKTIKEGFNNLQPINNYNNLYYSAMARACADWMVGLNFTQAITLASKKNYPISIGRVQTPTLKIIVDRYKQNRDFVSGTFYTPYLIFAFEDKEFELISKSNFKSVKEVDNFFLKPGDSSYLIFKKEKKNSNPPSLFDLTLLQKEAFASFKFTAQETLNLAQKLYENKIITYPRTDSKHLAENQKKDVLGLINNIFTQFKIENTSDFIDFSSIESSSNFNNSKISDHHAIIPTLNFFNFKNCESNEKKLFFLIFKRFIESFSLKGINSSFVIETTLNGVEFKFSDTVIEFFGWRGVEKLIEREFEGCYSEKETKKGEDFGFLRKAEDGNYNIVEENYNTGKTKAPSLYNDASLLTAMENCGKNIEELEGVLKDKGLGTPATRASILEVLIKREYVSRIKNSFIPSELGIGLIESLGDYKIVDAVFTGEMEHRLMLVENGEDDLKDFMVKSKDYVSLELPNIIKAGDKLKEIKSASEKGKDFSYGRCPKCKKGEIKKSKTGGYCSLYKEEEFKCDFGFWKKIAGKTLTEKNIKDLIEKGYTNKIKGFKSKAGKVFEAKLVMNDKFKIIFDFK